MKCSAFELVLSFSQFVCLFLENSLSNNQSFPTRARRHPLDSSRASSQVAWPADPVPFYFDPVDPVDREDLDLVDP